MPIPKCDCGGSLDLADIRIMGYDVPKDDPYNIYVLMCDDCGKISPVILPEKQKEN